MLLLFGTGCDASLPEPESPAAQLYRQRCAVCHRLYAPKLLTAPMWDYMMTRMEQEMLRRRVSPLSPEERRTILEYLRKHSSQGS